MEALLGIAGLIAVGAITPGPNNFVVMREAARAGWAGALPAIAGVVAGSLALLALVAAGAGVAFAAEPRLAVIFTAGGCLYLAWLGARLVANTFTDGAPDPLAETEGLPAGVRGLIVFQLVNPKGWILVLTATSAAQASLGTVAALPYLAALFVVIPASCLVLWSSLGLLMTRHLSRPRVAAWLDRAMGGLLLVFALLLLLSL